MNNNVSLSLVITAYTDERINDIYELLESVRTQTYPNMETIFVVERSVQLKDKINAFIGKTGFQRIRVIFSDEKLGLSMARNLGIKNAGGDIIAFTDDDVVLFPDWAEEMAKGFKDDSIIGATGAALPLWEDKSQSWLPGEFYWLVSCTGWQDLDKSAVVRGVLGANMAFKKEAFNNNFLFSPDAGYAQSHQYNPVSDDLEFSLRLRSKTPKSLISVPSARIWHRVYADRLSFRYVTAKSQEVGRCRRILKKSYTQEFGAFQQEKNILHSIFKRIIGTPKKLVTNPGLACKETFLTFLVLFSVAVGYIFPAPLYSPKKGGK